MTEARPSVQTSSKVVHGRTPGTSSPRPTPSRGDEGRDGAQDDPNQATLVQTAADLQHDTTDVEPAPRVPWSRRPTSPQRIRAAERRRRAVELRSNGQTFREIGQELGVSTQRAHALVSEALRHDAITDARRFAELRGQLLQGARDRVDAARRQLAHNDTRAAHDELMRALLGLERLVELIVTGEVPRRTGPAPANAHRVIRLEDGTP